LIFVSRFAAPIKLQNKPGQRMARVWAFCAALLGVQLLAWSGVGAPGWGMAQARERHAEVWREAATPAVRVGELPREAQHTLQLIQQGGPFPYAKDGIVFGNYEHILPQRRRGYYHEYTVPTPGSRNRGARRLVCGGPPRTPELCYYTHDHYASFQAIAH
jgi:ribonuclease T1